MKRIIFTGILATLMVGVAFGAYSDSYIWNSIFSRTDGAIILYAVSGYTPGPHGGTGYSPNYIMNQVFDPTNNVIRVGVAGGGISVDTVDASYFIVNGTAGDSVIIKTNADQPMIMMSINGLRDSIYMGNYVWYLGSADWGVKSGYFRVTHATLPDYGSSTGSFALRMLDYPRLFGTAAMGHICALGYTDSTKGVVADSMGWRTKATGGVGVADTLKATKGLFVSGRDSGQVAVRDTVRSKRFISTNNYYNFSSGGYWGDDGTYLFGNRIVMSTIGSFVADAGVAVKLYPTDAAKWASVYGGKTAGYLTTLGYTDSTKGWIVDSAGIRTNIPNPPIGGTAINRIIFKADSFSFYSNLNSGSTELANFTCGGMAYYSPHWISVGAGIGSPYSKGLFGGSYNTTDFDTGLAWVGATIGVNKYSLARFHPTNGLRVLHGANAGVATNNYGEIVAAQHRGLLLSDSVANEARETFEWRPRFGTANVVKGFDLFIGGVEKGSVNNYGAFKLSGAGFGSSVGLGWADNSVEIIVNASEHIGFYADLVPLIPSYYAFGKTDSCWSKVYGDTLGGSVIRFKPYAAGNRPASPNLGDIIVISADKDSTLQYMGGAWQPLYVEP